MSRNDQNTSQAKAGPSLPIRKRLRIAFAVVAGLIFGMAGVAYSHGWFGLIFRGGSEEEDLGPVRVFDAAPPGPAPKGMVWIPGGVFWMGMGGRELHGGGHSEYYRGAVPRHKIQVDGFWMDKTEVTNGQFAKFVKATNYVTIAERWPEPGEFTDVLPEVLNRFRPHQTAILAVQPGAPFPATLPWPGLAICQRRIPPFSIVFKRPSQVVEPSGRNPGKWWHAVDGASWRYPQGPGSDLAGRDSYPVVHICYEDAVAYCQWSGKRLPTEAEWEFAARGGLDRKIYVWGDELLVNKKWMANTWQGSFPNEDTGEDGFRGLAPVASFQANGFGLYDMAGNAWEWCADWYQENYYAISPRRNPAGPHQAPRDGMRVVRGGSFACSDNYCKSYVPGARRPGQPGSSANHTGFRCAKSAR
jgi:formylglycine-generating enzyme required for sulfatase activity